MTRPHRPRPAGRRPPRLARGPGRDRDPRARRALLVAGLPRGAARRGRGDGGGPVPGLMKRVARAIGRGANPLPAAGRRDPPGGRRRLEAPRAARRLRARRRVRARRRPVHRRRRLRGQLRLAPAPHAARLEARLGRASGTASTRSPGNHDLDSPRGLELWREIVPARHPAPPYSEGLGFVLRLGPGAGAGPRHHLRHGRRAAARLGRRRPWPRRAPPTGSPCTMSPPSRWGSTAATRSTPCRRSGTVSGPPWRPGGVSVVLNGHEHAYARIEIRRSTTIQQVITGGRRGRPLRVPLSRLRRLRPRAPPRGARRRRRSASSCGRSACRAR